MPLFSAMFPFRDAEATLPEALESLAEQAEGDWETFSIDDASRDRSVALTQAALARDPRLRLNTRTG